MDAIRKLFGDGPIGEYAGPRAFFKTVSHPVYPTGTAYPLASEQPNVYRARKLKNVAFVEEPGQQALSFDETEQYAHIFNLEPLKYIEEGSVVLCFREGGRWYTIDKVLTGDPCCRSRLFRGAAGLQSINVEFEIWGDAVAGTADAGYYCPTGACPTLLHTWSTTLSYQSVPTAADEPLNVFDQTYHPVGSVIHRPSGWYIGSSMEIGDFGYTVFNGNPAGQTGKLVFFRRADFGQSPPDAAVTPRIGACVFGWSFDEDYRIPIDEVPGMLPGWYRYSERYDRYCFNPGPRQPAFRSWLGRYDLTSLNQFSHRGMYFGDIVPTSCNPLLMQISGVVPRGGVLSAAYWPGVELVATSCGEPVSPNGGFYLRGTITE